MADKYDIGDVVLPQEGARRDGWPEGRRLYGSEKQGVAPYSAAKERAGCLSAMASPSARVVESGMRWKWLWTSSCWTAMFLKNRALPIMLTLSAVMAQ